LSIQCDLLDSNKVIGSLKAMKSVYAGGAYTIGEWGKVFADVADDIVADIKSKINDFLNRLLIKKPEPQIDPASKLKKRKELYDAGLISKDEYDSKR